MAMPYNRQLELQDNFYTYLRNVYASLYVSWIQYLEGLNEVVHMH
jgi:hypothetical protein